MIVSDIDGSILRALFKNAQDQTDPIWLQALASEPPFPWIDASGYPGATCFQQARLVVFITGRGGHLKALTETWIKANLRIEDFRVFYVGWINDEQYLADKKQRYRDVIDECLTLRIGFPYEYIHVIEDDTRLVAWLVDECEKRKMRATMVHQIVAGEHCIVYPQSLSC